MPANAIAFHRTISSLKNHLVPHGLATRRVPLGVGRGMRFRLDLRHAMQQYVGFYEQEIACAVRELTRGIRSAVDVGSAEGWYACYFLTKTRAERVVAFEPSDRANELLANAQLAPNGLDRLLLVKRMVGCGMPGDGTVALAAYESTLPAPCLIKVDVDGGEMDVLRGALPLLRQRSSFRWIIETHSAELERDCAALLRAHRYRVTIIPNAWWRVIVHDQRPIAHNRWLSAEAD